jgi:hypothetical protein
VLKGQWGVGKTYMWKNLIREIGAESSLVKYSYVSLFGINSVADLRLAIVAKTQNLKGNNTQSQESWELGGTLRSVRSWLHDRLGDLREIPLLRQVTVGFETIAPLFLSDMLICFDDFERMGDELAPNLLGFISELKEERNCQVVMIMNDQELGEKNKSYEKYREKIVDLELLYSPTNDEVASIVLDDKSSLHQLVREHTERLDINNIRVLRRILDVVIIIHDLVKGMHKDVLRQAVHSAALFVRCTYERNDEIPTVVFLRSYSSFGAAFAKASAQKEGKEADVRESKWEAMLDKYSFKNMDEFDLTILEVVEKGYVEGSPLLEEARKVDRMYKARDLDQSFTDAWALFHDTFVNNEAELVTGLNKAFRRCVETISPLNLNGTVKLLRDLKQDAIASELIDLYIEHHKSDSDRFNLDEYAFRGEINDKEIIQKFDEIHVKSNPMPTLLDAVRAISRQSWSGADERVLDAATEGDLDTFFKGNHGRELGRYVKSCIRFGTMEGHTQFGERVRIVLRKISEESPVNAVRVSRYIN